MEQQRHRALACMALVVLLSGEAFAAQSIPLQVDDPAKLKEPWPMTCGVPFAKAALQDAANVRLLSDGREVACQVDRTATWPDGSVKWVLLSFRGRTEASYRVEWGEGVRRAAVPRPIGIAQTDAGMTIDTGAATFVLPRHCALVDSASLAGQTILSGAGKGAYVVDNRGRIAHLGGPQAEMQQRVLWAGPTHACVRSEGWYVADDGQRIARGITWLHFFAGSPFVKLVHRLVLTEDTNEVWFRYIGIDFPCGLTGPKLATFDTAKAFDDEATPVTMPAGAEAWMLQDDFPHFMSKTSHYTLKLKVRGEAHELRTGAACGEWCDLSSSAAGLTVVLRGFAEQFPKEFTATPKGLAVHLWAGRCGRELDFRAATLAKDYWGDWCHYAPGGPGAISKLRSNAQCSAKTHELWLMPHAGARTLARAATARRAHAAAQRVLVLPDPVYTCSTNAMGLPILHKDEKRFPKQERLISDFFDRIVLPYQVFPMTGYIAYGCNPYLQYGKDKKTGQRYAGWYRLRYLVDYNVRRNAWTLYARSAERKYFAYAERFNRFAGDMEMHHWDAGSEDKRDLKVRGGWAGTGDIHKPFYWAERSEVLTQGSSGTDIVNYVYQFYLTGDWHTRELASSYGDAMKRLYDCEKVSAGPSPFLIFRLICSLYSMEWDPAFGKMMHDVGRQIIDLDSPNGLTQKMAYGCLYKVTRNVSAALDYWLITGDERTKKGILKAVDYQYRFQRDGTPIAYQNGAAMYYTIAYGFTKRPEYLRMVNAALQTALQVESRTLAEDLEPGLEGLKRLPYRGIHLQLHPLFSTPIALKLMAEVNGPIPSWPLVQQAYDAGRAWAVFHKPAGQAVTLEMYYMQLHPDPIEPVVLGPDHQPVAAVQVEKEQRIPYYGDPGAAHFHIKAALPAELPAGTYRLGLSSADAAFRVIGGTVDRIVLECPEGVWLGGGGLAAGQPVYFRVPEGQETVKMFLGREVNVSRADGSLAKDAAGEPIGEVTLPVEGKHGFWRAEWHEPALIKFRNVDPVVSFGTSERWFQPNKLLDMARAEPVLPPAEATFVPGVIGQALQLNGKDELRFERGKELGRGTVHEATAFENFPGSKGTIELYFRANWNTTDYPVLNRRLHYRHFIHAGELQFYHRFGQGPMTSRPYAYADLLCRGIWTPRGQPTTKPCGNAARKYFRAGEWVHLAGTWVIDRTQKQRDDKAKFYVFINGKKRLRVWPYPRALASWAPFRIGEIAEWIRVGPGADGTLDELRISDVVRYESDFDPPTQPFEPDGHTKALFHFDGSAEGLGANGARLKVEYQDRK